MTSVTLDPLEEQLERLVNKQFLKLVTEEQALHRYTAWQLKKTGRPAPITEWMPDFDGFAAEFFADEDEAGPVILQRTDGVFLLYASRVNGLVGRRGAGKTWLAILATKQVLEAGGRVVYYDMEDKRSAWAGRLRQIGCDIDQHVRDRRVLWMKPGALPHDPTPMIEAVGGHFDLVVFDVMNRLISRLGGNVNDGNAETVWLYNNLFDPLADAGSTVLVLDHPNKRGQRSDAELDDLGPAGGVMRMNNAGGHVIAMKVKRSFNRDRIALATEEQRPLVELVCLKDRQGVFAEGDVVGAMRGDMALWGMDLLVAPPGPMATEEDDLAAEVRHLSKRLLAKMRAVGPMTLGQLKEATTPAKRWMVEAAMLGLLDEQRAELGEDGKYRPKEGS